MKKRILRVVERGGPDDGDAGDGCWTSLRTNRIARPHLGRELPHYRLRPALRHEHRPGRLLGEHFLVAAEAPVEAGRATKGPSPFLS